MLCVTAFHRVLLPMYLCFIWFPRRDMYHYCYYTDVLNTDVKINIPPHKHALRTHLHNHIFCFYFIFFIVICFVVLLVCHHFYIDIYFLYVNFVFFITLWTFFNIIQVDASNKPAGFTVYSVH